MKVAFCAAEASPFAKVGGLADVVGSLPKALSKLGIQVCVILPRYGCIDETEYPLTHTDLSFSVDYYDQTYLFQVLETTLPGSKVPIFFLDNPSLFGNEPVIYPVNQPDWEALRFDVFSHACLQFFKTAQWGVDVLHLHDWHTALIAQLAKTDPFFAHTAVMLSLHNAAYQGETKGFNRLKSGMSYSDAWIAVSPGYAEELRVPESSCGLDTLIQASPGKLQGILNGIDTTLFNPQTDSFLPQAYTVQSVLSGKSACKKALQQQLGLPPDKALPLFGMVTRLVDQKGLDILIPVLQNASALPAQFVIVGNGEARYEQALQALNQTPNIRVQLGFNLALGQQVYAGSDVFIMPSRFEPCGLGQMIALRYGSLPLVRQTGGLADTVTDCDENPSQANGFVFSDYSMEALKKTIDRVLAVWQNRNSLWWTMVERAMRADYSWEKSAQAYLKVYQQHLFVMQGK